MTVSMERDIINWPKGRGLSKKSYFPDCMNKPGSRHTNSWLSCSQLFTKVGLRNHEEVSQDHSRPFSPSRNWIGDPHFTSTGNLQILSQMDQFQAVGLLLWLGARRHWCRRRKYYICPAPLPKLGCHTLAFAENGTDATLPLGLLSFSGRKSWTSQYMSGEARTYTLSRQ